jgi:hypothetical protein
MTTIAFRKTLSANDVGATGGHQAGILIPKGEHDLLAFLPALDPAIKNPDAWLACTDELGEAHRFRFVYYNNKLHDAAGTRNEYRITWMTSWFRSVNARATEVFEISGKPRSGLYRIRVISNLKDEIRTGPARVQLRGWQRAH